MLQQTQVHRVLPVYAEFMRRFPTARKLAAASLSEVLKSWQGLGYNRRAKMLHTASQFPMFLNLAYRTNYGAGDIVQKLEALPGVGPYTARAVAAFAFNVDVIVIETNIRTAIIQHFFNTRDTGAGMIYHTSARKVSDAEIEEILTRCLPKGRAREWYSALMDHGAHLKRSGISHNAKSKTYTKQSAFTGSLREARGAILRTLTLKKSPQGEALLNLLGDDRREQLRTALAALVAEKLVKKAGKGFTLAD